MFYKWKLIHSGKGDRALITQTILSKTVYIEREFDAFHRSEIWNGDANAGGGSKKQST